MASSKILRRYTMQNYPIAPDLLISKPNPACLLVYCLYIVNLVVAVVGDRPLVISGDQRNVNSANMPF